MWISGTVRDVWKDRCGGGGGGGLMISEVGVIWRLDRETKSKCYEEGVDKWGGGLTVRNFEV